LPVKANNITKTIATKGATVFLSSLKIKFFINFVLSL